MVILVIFSTLILPLSPCLFNLAKGGITSAESNWIIIEAVIYGVTPKAKMENLVNPPPPSKFMIPKKEPSLKDTLWFRVAPGIVIKQPKRKNKIRASVNSTLFNIVQSVRILDNFFTIN